MDQTTCSACSGEGPAGVGPFRLQLAHLPFVKTFEQFDFSFQPSIDETLKDYKLGFRPGKWPKVDGSGRVGLHYISVFMLEPFCFLQRCRDFADR